MDLIEPAQETKNFIKAIMQAEQDQSAMIWFRAGAGYIDRIFQILLTLPENDPSLKEIIKVMESGQILEQEVIVKNLLRWDMARPEMDAFVRAHISGRAFSTLMYCRLLLQESAKMDQQSEIPNGSIAGFLFGAARIIFRVVPIIVCTALWYKMRAAFKSRKKGEKTWPNR